VTSPDPQIVDMIQQVNESLLYYYDSHLVAFGPRYTGTENCTKASKYIYEEFHAMGLPVEFHYWTFTDFTDRDVVATLQGTDTSSNAIFIICGHYDTVRISPGANDDGSGVAAVLAIAKILSQYSFNYTIRFIAFSGEEEKLYGSFSYARDVSRQSDNIVAVLNVDGVGYANTEIGGRTLQFFCPERSKWIADFATTISTLYRNQIDMTVETLQNYPGADHQSFVLYGYDGVWIGEYDAITWYHSQNDTLDRINWTYLTKATKFILVVLAEFASTSLELQVIITTPYPGYFYFFNRPLLPLDHEKNGDFVFRGTAFILGKTNMTIKVTPKNDIKYVLYCIDGELNPWQLEVPPQYEWTIQGSLYPLIGRHIISVYAYTTSGNIAFDEINILIFTLDFYFRPN
jgi:hypothetical protein